jgi:hypothetical protein
MFRAPCMRIASIAISLIRELENKILLAFNMETVAKSLSTSHNMITNKPFRITWHFRS